ncbi:MAG: zinc-binding protein [Devosia sp.]|uniref:DNA gyrase inhibitor YacG n=1 Tax=Devosia sp. TaxID=1871048 RepID=UPI002633A6B1|nr:DNA gyrase inhibitor YacG [Devosia sp.]MDB5541554.1 zinc-binding protein [Devosia sp.]
MAAEIIKLKPTRPCPICGKPSSQQFHPFCSGRCSDIDLNRWLSGSYVIPAEPVEEDGAVKPGDEDEEE